MGRTSPHSLGVVAAEDGEDEGREEGALAGASLSSSGGAVAPQPSALASALPLASSPLAAPPSTLAPFALSALLARSEPPPPCSLSAGETSSSSTSLAATFSGCIGASLGVPSLELSSGVTSGLLLLPPAVPPKPPTTLPALPMLPELTARRRASASPAAAAMHKASATRLAAAEASTPKQCPHTACRNSSGTPLRTSAGNACGFLSLGFVEQ
mmetsp:Transcript_6430/g.15851  ORF Transcript_6430/g.15851 Transcript_6430/m.15851 type:complete len:213 (+) Transcript_6430:854-1492(+)